MPTPEQQAALDQLNAEFEGQPLVPETIAAMEQRAAQLGLGKVSVDYLNRRVVVDEQ